MCVVISRVISPLLGSEKNTCVLFVFGLLGELYLGLPVPSGERNLQALEKIGLVRADNFSTITGSSSLPSATCGECSSGKRARLITSG